MHIVMTYIMFYAYKTSYIKLHMHGYVAVVSRVMLKIKCFRHTLCNTKRNRLYFVVDKFSQECKDHLTHIESLFSSFVSRHTEPM